jgi:hypothetical protein
MSEPGVNAEESSTGEPPLEVDPASLQALLEQMKAEQSLPRGVLAGVAAGAVSALIWALITKSTGYEIGWIAIGVGFLVGFAVRAFGKGIEIPFNVVGAVLALLSVMVGKVLAACMLFAKEENLNAFEVFGELPLETMITILKETFSGMDLLFYGLAVWAGWQSATRQVTHEELASVLRSKAPDGA